MVDAKTAYLGLGGNIGDVLSNMSVALQQLDLRKDTQVYSVSKIYKTPPWGITDQDWFLNCCASLRTKLGPHELLDACLNIEIKLKRERLVRWGPRSVDVDILVFGDVSLEDEILTIPHPRMQERAFVMEPLSDIAPDLVVKGKSVRDWAISLADERMDVFKDNMDWWKIRI